MTAPAGPSFARMRRNQSPSGVSACVLCALPDARQLKGSQQDREQVVREGGEMGLGVRGDLAVSPSLLLMKHILEDIEYLFDLPRQPRWQRVGLFWGPVVRAKPENSPLNPLGRRNLGQGDPGGRDGKIFLPRSFLPTSAWGLQAMKRGVMLLSPPAQFSRRLGPARFLRRLGPTQTVHLTWIPDIVRCQPLNL